MTPGGPQAWIGSGLLAAAIAGSALAVGTVHTVTLCIVTALLAAAAALVWWDAEPIRVRPAATVLLVTGIGLTAYTALQCVPLPMRWLSILAPYNGAVWSRALSPLREPGPGWTTLTLDPGATRVEVLKGVAYLLAFVTALRLARRRGGIRFLASAIMMTGVMLAVAALLHPAFGAHKLFGLYEPTAEISARHLAPLMNPNNLAGYLNLALCLALAATFAPEPDLPRPITGAAALLLGATQIWVASRAGVITMVLGALLALATVHVGRSRRQAVSVLTLSTGAVAALGAALIVFGGSDDASSELLQADISKLTSITHMLRMLPQVVIFGCGRGAFESAYQAFRVDPGNVTYAYPENIVAQWVSEWGLPVGLAGLAALAYALRPSAVLARSATAAGAWAGIVAVTVQNLADLGSEIPGLVLAGVVCAAIVVAGTRGDHERWRVERWGQTPRALAIGGPAVAAAGIALAASGIPRELHADQRTLYEAVAKRVISAAGMRATAREAMLRHPAEPYLPFIAGLRALSFHDDNPIPWLAAALERASIYAPAHMMLARTLSVRSPSQARLEYRLTIEQAPELSGYVINDGSSDASLQVESFVDAMELVPSGKAGAPVLERLVSKLAYRLPATSMRLDEELAARVPAKFEPALRAAEAAVEDVKASDPAVWCNGASMSVCLREAIGRADGTIRIAGNECEPHVLRARARIAAGEAMAALTELQAATDTVTDRVGCLQALEGIAQTLGDESRANAALNEIARAGCSDDKECAQNLRWVAAQEEAAGNPRKALVLYRRASERAPEDDNLLESVARLAVQAGLHNEAVDSYEKLARRHPLDARWTSALEVEREAVARNAATAPL